MNINDIDRIQSVKRASILAILRNINTLALLIPQQEDETLCEESYMLIDESLDNLIEVHSGDMSFRDLQKTLRRTNYVYHEIVDEIHYTEEIQRNKQNLENAALD